VDQAAEEEDEVSILTVSISVKKFYYIFIPWLLDINKKK
jgi:hypothetical protein